MKEFERWVEKVTDCEIKTELYAIKDDDKEIEDGFYKELSFGTGGLRGIIGAGTNRMNVYTVGKATFGLAEYLLSIGGNSVVIAYDSRNKSAEFAQGLYGLPKSDVLRFKSETGRLIIRPSSTEPKMKIYLQSKGKDVIDAQEKMTK